jgi:hypothetical protein
MHPTKNRNIFVCLVFFLVFCSPLAFSQSEKIELKDYTDFNRSLARAGAPKIRKAEKHFRKAELTMGKAQVYDREIQHIRDNSKRVKSRKIKKLEEKKIQKEIEAYYFYHQAHKRLFKLYKKKLKKYRAVSTSPDEGVQIEKSASAAFKRAKKRWRKAENKDKVDKAYPLYADAYTFAVHAINHQIDAFAHYQSTTVPIPSEELLVEEVMAEDSIVQEKMLEETTDSLIVDEPEIPVETLPVAVSLEMDSLEMYEPVADSLETAEIVYIPLPVTEEEVVDSILLPGIDTVLSDAPLSDTMALVPEDTVTVINELVVEPVEEPEVPSFDLFFAIQFLSKTSPATNEQLKQLYKGPGEPYLMKSNGYYRYLVGRFETLSEVKAFKDQHQIEGFIVAYKDGKKISVQEAIDLLEEKD